MPVVRSADQRSGGGSSVETGYVEQSRFIASWPLPGGAHIVRILDIQAVKPVVQVADAVLSAAL